jgi:hypothetical protein
MYFQIDYSSSGGGHSFEYFEAKNGAEFKQKSNEMIVNYIDKQNRYSFSGADVKNIKIREYDTEKNCVIKKGFDYIATKVTHEIITFEVLTEPNIK